ncbi:hypothetical protein [Luteimonas sp. A482]
MIQPRGISTGSCLSYGTANDKGSWKAGLTLTVGTIVNHKGEEVESLLLEPQGIAHLISEECIELPDKICALAHVLTRMCNEGLLTLNIGVIDPSWKNNLSSPVLNFSSERRLLKKGDKFIRLTFHSIEPLENLEGLERFRNTNEAEYVSGIRSRAVANFGKNFLDIKSLVGKASKKENARFRDAMLKYLPIGAFSLAFFALLVTTGIATVSRLALDSKQDAILRRLDKLEVSRGAISSDEMPLRNSSDRVPSEGGGE